MKPKERVLIVEDDPEWQKIVSQSLEGEFICDVAGDFATAKNYLEKNYYDILLLDVYLPDKQGFDICAFVRHGNIHPTVPMLLLSSQGDLDHKIVGFKLGADDYIVKPIDPIELKLKMRACLNRALEFKSQADSNQTLVKQGALILDLGKQKAFLNNEEKKEELDLTPKEFKLLSYLARHSGMIFERNQIIDAVYSDQLSVSDRNIDSIVSRLRKKMGICKDYIKSVYGAGYSFEPTVA